MEGEEAIFYLQHACKRSISCLDKASRMTTQCVMLPSLMRRKPLILFGISFFITFVPMVANSLIAS